jgi:hypothetical protein
MQKQKLASSFETTPQRNRGPSTPTWQCRWGKRYFKPVGFGYQIYPNLRPDEIHGQSNISLIQPTTFKLRLLCPWWLRPSL